LPFVEWEFLKEYINFAGEHIGCKSFFWVKKRVQGGHIMPHDLGPTPTGEDSFDCVNLWILDQSLAYETRKISFINYFGYLGLERGLQHDSRIRERR